MGVNEIVACISLNCTGGGDGSDTVTKYYYISLFHVHYPSGYCRFEQAMARCKGALPDPGEE
jgi:hypothetical protein